MARPTRSQAVLFAELIAELEPEVHRAFMASVTDLQANVDWKELLKALENYDIENAIKALNIDPAAWAEYSSKMTDVYAKSGASTVAQITQTGIGGVGVRFRMTEPRAQAWILENVANKVVAFSNEQIATARELINKGFISGAHPHTMARDLAGRAYHGGMRQGGILGLDAPRAERYRIVTEAMRSPEGVKSIVTKHADGSLSVDYKVNKATANRILRAYRKGEAVPEAERAISEMQYKNALLKARADTIAETETGNAVMSARNEAWQQTVESRGLDKSAVIKTWRHRRGASANHRADHRAMSGKSVRGLDTPFEFPDGATLQHAHDPDGGAKHVIRCGCDTEYRLDHSRGLK